VTQFLLYAGLGLAAGVLYAGVGLGVVTTFKATGVVNLAQVGFGMWGAFTYQRLRADGSLVLPIPGLPTPSLGAPATMGTAFVIALLSAAVLGGLSYLLVFRELRRASTVANLVASTGLLIVIQSLMVLQFGTAAIRVDAFLPTGTLTIGGAAIPVDRVWAAAITVAVTAVLAAWFRWTRTGLAMRGASESQLNVALARWSPVRLATTGWMLGAVVSASLTLLVAPAVSLSPGAFGLLIVPGLAAALVGRLSSLPWTCAGGLLLGIVQAEIGNWSTKSWWPGWARVGVAQLVPFLAVTLVLVLRGSKLPFRGEPVAARLPSVRPQRPRLLVVLPAGAAGGIALALTSGVYRFGIITSMVLAILFLSVVVLTGFTGQLSLGQAAIAGVAGFTLARFDTGVPFPINLVLAAAIATVVGVVIGAPALRIRGAQLAIVSIAGAVALESLVFQNPSFTKQSGTVVHPASLFGIDLGIRKGDDIARLGFGIVVLVVLALTCCGVACITAGRTGRRFLAIRGDERAAASVGIDVARTKLVAIATASFVAGLSGGLLGFVRGQLTADSFSLFVGIAAVAYAAIGGVTRVAGALLAGSLGSLGIVYVIVNQRDDLGNWYALATGLGVILAVVLVPDGLAGAVEDWFARRRRVPLRTDLREHVEFREHMGEPPVARQSKVLTVSDLRVAYGGVVAVDGVSFEAHGGEILGIVGPNGAGKTSLLDGICGFVPTTGSVTLDDVALPSGRPHTRQALGIGRTWQHGALFDDLTVLDNLAVAADPARPGDVLRDLRSASGVERKRLLEVLEAWGIADIADRKPVELSIGRRKLVDIARAVAAEPTVLLADEPAAGLDDWESEELATRLRSYAATGRTVVLIEHDLSLVRRVCDRILVLDFGRVLATGEPEVVLGQPKVAAAYLGLAGTGAAS